MSILQELEESLESSAPFYMEFLYRYNPKKKQAFAFYEGDEDASYYHQILERYLDADCELEEIVAGCKNNVIRLSQELDWNNYSRKNILFFVDRDLSFWLDEPTDYAENVFVTDGYSVENYITTTQSFRLWLQMFKGFARASKQEIDNMVHVYEVLKDKFERLMMPIMARAVIGKKQDKEIRLSDFKMTKNLQFQLNDDCMDFCLVNDTACFEKWNVNKESDEAISNQISIFTQNIGSYSVRGKWMLFFMAELGEFMRLHANYFAPSLGDKEKIPPTCSVASSQCMPALAPHCSMSPSPRLQYIISITYGEYFQSAA